MSDITSIKGGIAADHRGSIRFVNDFDMTQVKRFYIIENADTELIRGWRAHRIEQRWFHVLDGGFLLKIVKIDNWDSASHALPITEMVLQGENQHVIHVPPGFATAFQALSPSSRLMVFADFPIAHAANDDYTYPLNYFKNS